MADVRADFELNMAGTDRQVADLERRLDALGDVDVRMSGLEGARRDAGQVADEVGRIDDEAQQAERATIGLKDALGAAVAILGAREIAQGIKAAVDAASDLEESSSKAATVFGDSFERVERAAKESATAVGLAEDQYLDAAGTLGNLFTAQGLAGDAAAQMSQDVVALAADVASFNNLELEDSLDKLRAGLLGETEPLKSVGIAFSAAAVEAKAFELGLAGANGEIDEGAKIQARYALIMEQTTTLQGDFARTSEGLANQQRILAAEFRNAQASIGAALLPTAQELVGVLREDALPSFVRLAEEVLPILVEAFEAFAPMLGLTFDLISALAPVLGLVVDLIERVPDPLLQAAAAGALLNRAVGPMGGLLERATGGMRGMRGASLNLGTAVRGIGLAAVALTVIDLVNAFGEGGRAAEEFADELEEAGVRGEDAIEQLRDRQRETIDEFQEFDFSDFVANVRNPAATLRDALGTAGEWLGLRDAIAETGEALGGFDPAREIEQRLPLLAAELDLTTDEVLRLAEAAGVDLAGGTLPDVIRALIDAAAASDEFSGGLAGAAAETQELTDAQLRLQDAFDGFTSTADVYKQTLEGKEAAERKTAEETAAATESAEDSWEDYVGAVQVSIGEYLGALEEQLTAQREWQENLATIAARAGTEVAAELAELGVEGAGLVAQFANASDAELRRFATLVAEDARLASDGFVANLDFTGAIEPARAAAAELRAAFPETYSTMIEVLGLPEAIRRLEEMRAAVEALPDRIRTQVSTEFGGTRGGPGGLQPGAAHGAIFDPVPGGHTIRVAEAGSREIVVPTDDRPRAADLLRAGGLGDLLAGPRFSFDVTQNVTTSDPLLAARRSATELRDDVYRRTGNWL